MSATIAMHGPTVRPVRRAPRAARSVPPVPPVASTASRPPAGHGPAGELRLTARGRVVVAAVALGAALFGGNAVQQAVADAPEAPVDVATWTVAPGETLWDVAARHARPGQDVREVVDAIVDLNGVAAGSLAAGQQILVPAP